MRVLFLGPADSPVYSYLRAVEGDVVATSTKIDTSFAEISSIDFLVSYGYRHILKKDILDLFQQRAINLHISLLPWNRGADPNLWSFAERTPKGVSIHYMDEGIDTGDLIVQTEVVFDEPETLRSSYERLCRRIEDLFIEWWPRIRDGRCPRYAQPDGGSVHRVKDKDTLTPFLTEGWDTPVVVLDRYATARRQAAPRTGGSSET